MDDTLLYLYGVGERHIRLPDGGTVRKTQDVRAGVAQEVVGGICSAVGVGMLVALWQDASVPAWAGAGGIVAVTGVFGDLVESMFKRSAGVKDSGAIIPGHGGFMDRFDALIFSVPFVFAYFTIFAG